MDQVLTPITFDAATHTYRVRGAIVPNVTKILDGVLTDFSKVPRDVLEYARQRGTAVHTACELYDLGTLDYTTLDESLYPYLEAWIKFLKDTQFQIEGIEQVVYSACHQFAGTLDRFGRIKGRRCVVDIKTSADVGQAPGVQIAAYELAGIECGVLSKTNYERHIVQLMDTGMYQLHTFTGAFDCNVFLSCLNIYRWKLKNGIIKETTP